MNKKRLVFICFTALSFAFLCACTNKDGKDETTAAVAETVTAAEESGASAEMITTQADTTASSALPNETPATPAEIVDYFNLAANRVKSDKPGYTFTMTPKTEESKITISENVPFRDFIAKFIVSAINKSSKEPVTIEKGSTHDEFPAKGHSWASKLVPAALSGATCTDKGGYYEIELKFREEKLSALPDEPETTMHGKAFSLLTNQDFRQAFGGFDVKLPGLKINVGNEKFVPAYKGCYIQCKIEKSTGSMMSAVYYLNTYSAVDTMVLVNKKTTMIGIKMEYSVTEEYKFG
jgi:hypothetical protein